MTTAGEHALTPQLQYVWLTEEGKQATQTKSGNTVNQACLPDQTGAQLLQTSLVVKDVKAMRWDLLHDLLD